MDPKNPTWLFYSYDSKGNDIILPIVAPSRSKAFEIFDNTYGEDIQIDFVVQAGYQYEG